MENMLRALPLDSRWRAKTVATTSQSNQNRSGNDRRNTRSNPNPVNLHRLRSDLVNALPPGLPPVLAPLFPADGMSQPNHSPDKQLTHHQISQHSVMGGKDAVWPPGPMLAQATNSGGFPSAVTPAIDWVSSPRTSPYQNRHSSPLSLSETTHPLLPHMILSQQLNLGPKPLPVSQALRQGSPTTVVREMQANAMFAGQPPWNQIQKGYDPSLAQINRNEGYKNVSPSSDDRAYGYWKGWNNNTAMDRKQRRAPPDRYRGSNQRRPNSRSYPTRSNQWRPNNGNGRETNRQMRQETDEYNNHEPGPDGDAQKPVNVMSKVESVHTTEASGGGSLVVRREKGGHVDVRIVYARDFMLQCAYSPFAILPPQWLPHMVREHLEVLPKLPKKFDPKDYKKTHLKR